MDQATKQDPRELARCVLWWNMARGGEGPEPSPEMLERMAAIQRVLTAERQGRPVDRGPLLADGSLALLMEGTAYEGGIRLLQQLVRVPEAETEPAGPGGSHSESPA